MGLRLFGYRYSVYTRIARMALAVRDLQYDIQEVDPFDDPVDPDLSAVSPFNRVPVLDHDGFVLFETSAITRYVATQFPGPALIPKEPRAAARMEQVIAVVDAHGYRPMVRQVFAHSVFRPLMGQEADPGQITQGLKAAGPVLRVLDSVAAEAMVLNPGRLTLADLHLAPVMGYFLMSAKRRAPLGGFRALGNWWQAMSRHPAYVATEPGLATAGAGG